MNVFSRPLQPLFCALALCLASCLQSIAADTASSSRKFSFGPGTPPDGFTAVAANSLYSEKLGYGFEPGTSIVAQTAEKNPGGGFCTSDKPFYFSVALPEGNYRVSVTLGDSTGESDTTVKAELRRLMLEQVKTAKGEVISRTFSVNIRVPQIAGTADEVSLKPREKTMEIWAWDNRLTLEFNGSRPCLSTLEITRTNDIPTIYLLGDSTVCDQPREPWASWGQMLTAFFKPSVAIANHAESGESARSSQRAQRFDKVFSTLKRGDYVIIQFAHNDEKDHGDGIGPFTSYKTALTNLVTEIREHESTPILVTPMHRRTFDAHGKITNSHGDYPEAMRQVAQEKSVVLIDLLSMSKDFYEALGAEKSSVAFATVDGKVDGTHHNAYGAYELAKCIVKGIRASQPDLAHHLIDGLPPFDPRQPDPVETFKIPVSPQVSVEKPYGN